MRRRERRFLGERGKEGAAQKCTVLVTLVTGKSTTRKLHLTNTDGQACRNFGHFPEASEVCLKAYRISYADTQDMTAILVACGKVFYVDQCLLLKASSVLMIQLAQ